MIRAGGGAFAAHREHVAFDVDVERFKTHTRQIELHDDLSAFAPGVHRHERGPRGCAEQLLCPAVDFPEGSVSNTLFTSLRADLNLRLTTQLCDSTR